MSRCASPQADPPYRILLLGDAGDMPGLRDRLLDAGDEVQLSTAAQDVRRPADVLVIGPADDRPLATAESFRRHSPRSQIVFTVPAARLERFRAILPFAPAVADAWTTAVEDSAAAAVTVIHQAAQVSRRRHALAAALSQINRHLSAASAVAEQEQREQRLAQSERYLATLLTQAPDAILAMDAGGTVIAWNEAAARLLPVERNAAGGTPGIMLFAQAVRGEIAALLSRAVLGESITQHETQVLTSSGAQIDAELSLAPVRDRDGAVTSLSAIVRDIRARKAAQAALQASEEQFHSLADSVPQLVWMARADGWIYWFNRRWYEYTGTTPQQMEGWGWQSVHDARELPAVLERWRTSIETGASFEMVFPLRGADGRLRPFLTRVVPVRDALGSIARWFGTNTDVSAQREAEETLRRLNEVLERRVADEIAERMRAEETLRQAQKMEALGQLSGGIAHDYNNLLHVIRNAVELLQRRLTAIDPDTQRTLDMIRRNADRAATLTRRLLAFSRRQPLEMKPVSANRLVAGMAELLRHSIGESIALETVLGAGAWWMLTDANQLESAILNLAVNARDAMPQGGKLTVETANTFLDEAYTAAHELAPGQYVMIAVSDTGHGMTREIAERAFDPFFTTKELGKGTGLGLSQVYGFIKQSGGHVKIYSEPGEGTTVKMYLPRSAAPQASEWRPEPPSVARVDVERTILVVEDEEDVRTFTADALRELGYRVLEASDGPAALQILERAEGVDLLFTDVGLPRMNGRQLAQAASQLRPGLKVLYTTGYARNAIVHQGRLDPDVELLVKPFTQASLASKIAQILER